MDGSSSDPDALASIATVGRRYVILGALAVLVLALSVPAVGSQTEWFGLAKKASKTAKKAKKRAKQASSEAQLASREAQLAIQASDRLRAELARTRIISDAEAGLVSSTSPIGSYAARGGPSVQVTVPSSGLIEVWARVDINEADGGAVGLYEDGRPVPGVSDPGFCGDDSAIIEMNAFGGAESFDTFSSPPVNDFSIGCTSTGAPAPVLLRRPPGNHTYELRYSHCECPTPGTSADFRNRVLRVGPRL